MVLTDWGVMYERLTVYEAGLDLEMPGSEGYIDQVIVESFRQGELSEERLNESVDRLLDLIFITTKIAWLNLVIILRLIIN